MCCAAKTGGPGIDLTNYECKKYHLEGSGLISNLHVIRFVLQAALGPNKVEAKKIKKTEEMGHMISRDKACLKATRKPLKYLMESQRERREAAEETGLI